MARSTKQPPKRGTLEQMPSAGVALEEPPAAPETPFDAEPPHEADNNGSIANNISPPESAPKPSRPRGTSHREFFEIVRSVAKADWGTRIFLYLYCFEPICNEKISGEKKYLCRFDQPIADQQEIMIDYGSGKYRLVLANNKPLQQEKGQAIETLDFEIYNPKYPPRIPREVWKNDPRNQRWLALLPKEGAAPPPAAPNPLDAFGTFMDIQDRMEERLKPAQQSPPPAQPAANPFDVAQQIMQMRANDPMIAALMQRLDAADKAQEAARAREFELMKELRHTTAAPPVPAKSLADQLIELIPVLEKLEPVKKFFGFSGPGEAVRAGKTTAYDMIRDLASTPFGQNLGQGLGMLFSSLGNRGAAANGAQPQPIIPAATVPAKETDEQRIQRIGQAITQPMLYEYFLKDLAGDAFAERMFDLWPEDYVFIRKLGAENLVNRYRQFPQAWAVIGPKEPAFIEFIQEFCAWSEQAEDAEGGVIDLEEEA